VVRTAVGTLLIALLAVPTAHAQRPLNRTGTVPSPAVFDVRDYGAVPNDGLDDSPSVQAAVNAAGRVKGVVYLPGGPYQFGSTVLVSGVEGLTIKGDGPATEVWTYGGYAGPLWFVGPPCKPGDVTPANRPACLPGDYDGSVTLPRYAVATGGNRALAVTSHPLQFGPLRTDGGPSNWRTPGVFSLDCYLEYPPGADHSPGRGVLGTYDAHDSPLPWSLLYGDGAFWLMLGTETGTLVVPIPADMTAGRWRLSVQVEPSTGRVAAWVGGVPAPVQPVSPFAFVPHDGFAPVLVGASAGSAKLGADRFTNVIVRGLRVGLGPAPYLWRGPVQANADGSPATDADRFFRPVPGTAGVFPLTDPPGRLWVQCDTTTAKAAAFWVAPAGWTDTKGVAFEAMSLKPGLQPGILIGNYLDLRLTGIDSQGGAQGIGSLPSAYSWPLALDRCTFGGYDAPVFLYGCSVWSSARHCNFIGGRHGLRVVGWTGKIEMSLFANPPAWAEAAVVVRPVDDGVKLTLENVNVDNEESDYSVAILQAEQGAYAGVILEISGLLASIVRPGTPVVDLIGHGIGGAYSKPSRLTARDVGAWTADAMLLRVGPGWDATMDGRPVAAPSPGAAPD
jgi:hypothetical protein